MSNKSLDVLDGKLVNMAETAMFEINTNVVLGSGVKHPESTLLIARRAREPIRRAFHEPKECAPHCTIGCVHRASTLDRFRPQRGAGPRASFSPSR